MPSTRRGYLAALAAGAGVAGCLGTSRPGSPTPSPTDNHTTSPPSASNRLLLERTELAGRFTVFAPALREWLREAARSGETLRVHAPTPVYAPEPVLTTVDAVRLVTPDGAVDGVYEVRAEGGPRYELYVGASAVENVPEDADPTPVSDLSGSRRETASAAISGARDEAATVFPETALGEWVRHEFFGGYFRHDGAVYRGHEIQQTDAAFFSEVVWLVLDLSPTDAGSDAELRLSAVDDALRGVAEPLLEGRRPDDARLVSEAPASDDVAAAVSETEGLLTHTAAFSVSLTEG